MVHLGSYSHGAFPLQSWLLWHFQTCWSLIGGMAPQIKQTVHLRLPRLRRWRGGVYACAVPAYPAHIHLLTGRSFPFFRSVLFCKGFIKSSTTVFLLQQICSVFGCGELDFVPLHRSNLLFPVLAFFFCGATPESRLPALVQLLCRLLPPISARLGRAACPANALTPIFLLLSVFYYFFFSFSFLSRWTCPAALSIP